MKQHTFQLTTVAFLVSIFSGSVLAEQATELNDVYIKGSKKVHRKTTEITGLGKIVKNSNTINKEQVLDIRDLTRYDPGISVVEQGQGASTGYSIRGLDKNRVGLAVDGVPQIQYYTSRFNSVNSGAVNEIEYENIQSIEISKGASSSEFGSGSLGGSVQFRTKEASDIIQKGNNWGFQSKTAYTGKNNRFTQSLAAAGRENGFEALAIYTYRNGNEIKAHKDAGSKSTNVTHSEFVERNENNWFKYKKEDGTWTEPKHTVGFREPNLPENSVYHKITETMSGEELTGANRLLPNTMDTDSKSLLLKLGYHFNSQHFIGTTLENTRQNYRGRDMTLPAFWSNSDIFSQSRDGRIKSKDNPAHGIYLDDPFDGLAIEDPMLAADNGKITKNGQTFNLKDSSAHPHAGRGMKYTRVKLFEDLHKKNRFGINYRYQGGWLDALNFTFDTQNIELKNREQQLNCSTYPTVDKNCRATLDKSWSYYSTQTATYAEKHTLFKVEMDKQFDTYGIRHKVTATLGQDSYRSTHRRFDWYQENVVMKQSSGKGNGVENNPRHYELKDRALFRIDRCGDGRYEDNSCVPSKITGYNRFIGLKDHLKINKYVSLGFGARFDHNRVNSSDEFTTNGDYKNFSWNVGTVIKPYKHIAVSYRISNGFRVPSFQEHFGYRLQGNRKDTIIDDAFVNRVFKNRRIDPEKSLNQELSVSVNGDWGYLEASTFYNNYKDLITRAEKDEGKLRNIGFYNTQNIDLAGINILAKIDWNGVYNKIPEGFSSSFAYNKVKVKKVWVNPIYKDVTTPLLDTIQPARYIVGLAYDNPNEKWGIGSIFTYSEAKKITELQGVHNLGRVQYGKSVSKKASRSWFTVDLNGYYQFNKNTTLRAGINNVFNHRYVMWEQLRQTAESTAHKQKEGNYTRFAAPGRNYSLQIEMKF
ncbi:Transferrin-binding protein 1 precursor [Phocoenobacter uteri]|uniref:Transferrin-binding protein 1 n=1 Tax=Phocoenobacter uteri TaxID=146806 RepID=A0A379CCB9_9PAST|nr:lactoferrin/transferrin family TonB-dependent receptor [Phocoenobacter uteri]MDG6881903.1 hypothetical protein [Phocoenobacter uteri]SUB59941.1 Transferrin-binding protein 1 precursor [Phocoenobacter uteri]